MLHRLAQLSHVRRDTGLVVAQYGGALPLAGAFVVARTYASPGKVQRGLVPNTSTCARISARMAAAESFFTPERSAATHGHVLGRSFQCERRSAHLAEKSVLPAFHALANYGLHCSKGFG
jgi:hypothetical protein